jgi:RNA-directed DNA polymerase
MKLNGRAKAEPGYRFYSLFDKVYRRDVLEAAYAHVRANAGVPGVDGQTFEDIASYGVERYLAELAQEVREKRYYPKPVLRAWIEKEGKPGEYRPLGIPTIRDRTVQQAVKLLLDSIFEADLSDNAYAYREGRSAQQAVCEVLGVIRAGKTEVVDGDLSQYFDTIPHTPLMRSVERRIADRNILWMLRAWLKVPVHERNEKGRTVITGGKKTKCGTPQGGVISPLLANIYFRRFLQAWERFGLERKFQSRVVNYADDFVILTKGHAKQALEVTRKLMQALGLTLNEKKTRIVRAGEEDFTFLGYTFGRRYAYGGRAYLGLRPSDKSVDKYRRHICEATGSDQTTKSEDTVLAQVNRVTRGYWNYFGLGATAALRHTLDRFLDLRLAHWVRRKHGGQSPWRHLHRLRPKLVQGRQVPRRPVRMAACLSQ